MVALIVDIDKDDAKFKVNDPEVQRQARMKRLQRVIVKMYMGYLAIDKDFLEEIVSHPKIVTLPSEGLTTELVALAGTCYRNVMYLLDLLRMRRPLYVTLFKRRAFANRHKEMIERERKLRRNVIIIEADILLRRLQAARINKDYSTFFKFVTHSDWTIRQNVNTTLLTSIECNFERLLGLKYLNSNVMVALLE